MQKNRIRAVFALLLAFMLLFCACGPTTPEKTPNTPENGGDSAPAALTLSLPYYENDSCNPYFAQSALNRALSFLFCEPLYRVNAAYAAEAILAESASADKTSCTVTLRDATFSDGTAVTAEDVVYSFDLAKSSAWYGARLVHIDSARAGGKMVTFTLLSPDVYVQNLLTFPIVRRATADTAEQIPIGSGAFVLGGSGTLTQNPKKSTGAVEAITLVHTKDTETLGRALEIGNIDYLFEDFSTGDYTRIVAQNTFVTMNNLVYVGVQSASGALQSAAVRAAIYYAADREDIAASAYRGCATPASLPFHPAFCAAQALTTQTTSDTERATEILRKLGYSRYDRDGRLTNGQNTLQMSILVNQENSFRLTAAYNLAEDLNAAGFSVTVEAVSADVYKSRIAAGNFTLYIGEVKLSENLSLSPFFGGSASVGIDTELPVTSEYAAFCAGERTPEQFAAAFLDDMPFVPLCYRAGMAAYSKGTAPDFSTAAYDIYGDITRWTAA